MNNIKGQFVIQRIPETLSIRLGDLHANEDFSVVKRDHIGRSFMLEKFFVYHGDCRIIQQTDLNLFQIRKRRSMSSRRSQAQGKGEDTDSLEPTNIYPELILMIENSEHRRQRNIGLSQAADTGGASRRA